MIYNVLHLIWSTSILTLFWFYSEMDWSWVSCYIKSSRTGREHIFPSCIPGNVRWSSVPRIQGNVIPQPIGFQEFISTETCLPTRSLAMGLHVTILVSLFQEEPGEEQRVRSYTIKLSATALCSSVLQSRFHWSMCRRGMTIKFANSPSYA
jgi:hypothetical protein